MSGKKRPIVSKNPELKKKGKERMMHLKKSFGVDPAFL